MGPKRSLLLSISLLPLTIAQSISIPWTNCTSASSVPNSPAQITVTAVYAQLVEDPVLHLNLTVFGSTPDEIIGISDGDGNQLLATVFTTTSRLTFQVSSTTTAFCGSLRPPSPLPQINDTGNGFCPIPAGDIAFSSTTPLHRKYELLSLNTRIRVVDSSSPALELLCLDLSTSPLAAGVLHSVYGHAAIAFWVTVATAIAYWILVGIARIASAWNRGQTADPQNFWSHFQRVGFVLASAISGEKFATEPALLRFCTPSMRDILFHTQWCAALGMIAVQWPPFAYPIFAQAAWSTLTYNITLTQGTDSPTVHWNPLDAPALPPPQGFADQLSDPTSPLFVDPNSRNTLFNLPIDTHAGIESFAFAVGIRPQDLFGICLGLFLIVVGGAIALSSFVWTVDWLMCMLGGISPERRFLPVSRSRRWSLGARDALGKGPAQATRESLEDSTSNPAANPRAPSRTLGITSWWKRRIIRDSFHRDALWGNLIRIILLFHLPITIFSAYEFSRPRSTTAVSSMVLAALSFAAFSIAIPGFLLFRLSTTKAKKLYDDTRTLLALGPLYNQYASGSQTFAKLFFANNITLGVVIGSGQHSGTSQAIIILVAEVISALWTSVYLPWGRGAAMGTLSFVMCVARIITSVLLVILSPTVSVGVSAGSWIACAIFLIQAIIYGLYIGMFIVKVLEGILRLVFHIPFNRSRHAVDNGLIGVLSLLGVFGRRRRKKARTPRYQLAHTTTKGTLSSQDVLAKNSYDAQRTATSPRDPPSVLRVEQIGTPYREEADDETGHILGAWPPTTDPAESPGPSQPKSGFTRVRGGRANFDSPYAMMSTGAANETERNQGYRPTSPGHSSQQSGLPPGAIAPPTLQLHIRQKSETGMVGDFSALQSSSSRQGIHHPVSPSFGHREPYDDDDDDEDDEEVDGNNVNVLRRLFGRRRATSSEEAKRSPWPLSRRRYRSEQDQPALSDTEELSKETGRSFVVVRDKPPATSNRPSAE